MNLQILLFSSGSVLPPAHIGDAGCDIIASSDPKIVGTSVCFDGIKDMNFWKNIDYIEYDTEIKISPPDGYYALVYPRSSISKYNLLLCNSVGLIDYGYRGNIKLRFKYVFQPDDIRFYGEIVDTLSPDKKLMISIDQEKIYKKGDKIAQIVLVPLVNATPQRVEPNHLFLNTTRSDGGFGSTGI